MDPKQAQVIPRVKVEPRGFLPKCHLEVKSSNVHPLKMDISQPRCEIIPTSIKDHHTVVKSSSLCCDTFVLWGLKCSPQDGDMFIFCGLDFRHDE
eukprot:4332294-Amphidinium_carterae.1